MLPALVELAFGAYSRQGMESILFMGSNPFFVKGVSMLAPGSLTFHPTKSHLCA
jgi:hypothetical protein